MAKTDTKTKTKQTSKPSGAAVALGLIAAGAIAAGAAFVASRKQSDAGDDLVDSGNRFDVDDDIDLDDAPVDLNRASVAAVQTIPVGEPMRYTGGGTPDMGIAYTPGLDNSAGDESSSIGSAEQRDTMAGVRA